MGITNLQLAAVLETAFKKKPTTHNGQVRLTLDKEVTAAQFEKLAALCAPLGTFPAVVRSGAGVSVVFN